MSAMSASATDAYLRNAVLTATPEQLQLMLYDGAIRFASQGRDAIVAKDYETCYERFSRAQKIVLEMQGGLKFEVNPELCKQMSALYDFIYRRLVEASIHHDLKAVDDALRILHHQRETWVMLIDKLKSEATGSAPAPAPAPKRIAPPAASVSTESLLSVEG